MRFALAGFLMLVAAGSAAAADTADAPPKLRLSSWDRGIALAPQGAEAIKMYLWFYEWNMFDARTPGEHTRGTWSLPVKVSEDGTAARIATEGLRLRARATDDGAELTLEVRNRSEHDWPELAGIIPCFNPGPEDERCRQFANTKTWFVGAKGLERQLKREIHFNQRLRPRLDKRSPEGQFVFSEKWPTSDRNAHAGLLLRESTDGRWVTGIAWEDFLSAQGHNPWECMHLCIRVGPLARGESRTIRGRIYLFPGGRDDCLKRYREDFGEKREQDARDAEPQ